MKKEKLIFIYPKPFTFIRTEQKILESDFQLIIQELPWHKKILLPINFIRQFFFLFQHIFTTDKILISFGGYWSFLPTIFGKICNKKTAIVVHGTDCVDFPEIQYGNLRIPLMRWFTKKSYQWASIILPVSESLVYTENQYFSDYNLKLGYAHHLKGIKTAYKVIPNGLIVEDWQSNIVTKTTFSTISVMTKDQIMRKGGDLIVETAKLLPNITFYLAGCESIENAPKNVITLGRLSPEELKSWYLKTQFYLQLSVFEGFGVALCEAMLCRCVPIVSAVNFLPNIVGETGFVLNKRDPILLKKLLEDAFQKDLLALGELAKDRIKQNFTDQNRKEMLLAILKS